MSNQFGGFSFFLWLTLEYEFLLFNLWWLRLRTSKYFPVFENVLMLSDMILPIELILTKQKFETFAYTKNL